MLEKVFLQILNMSFTGGMIILFVLAARLVLGKAPKVFSYSLWAVALFRLICPFSIESAVSLIPTNPTPIASDIIYSEVPKISTGITAFDNSVSAVLPAPTVGASINPLQIWTAIGLYLWLLGIAALLVYSIITLVKLQRRLGGAVSEGDGIYLSDNINTPFVMGFIRPKIYLPSQLGTEEKQYIILHERTHIKRLDHIVKILSFFVLCLHWFNPLAWVAFFVSGKDMEMSCDEAVIKKLGADVKKDYSSSLLSLATGRRIIGATPLAFGEGDTKRRIKNVLNFKKPTTWVVVAAIMTTVALCVGFAVNPLSTTNTIYTPKTFDHLKTPENPSTSQIFASRYSLDDSYKSICYYIEAYKGGQYESVVLKYDVDLQQKSGQIVTAFGMDENNISWGAQMPDDETMQFFYVSFSEDFSPRGMALSTIAKEIDRRKPYKITPEQPIIVGSVALQFDSDTVFSYDCEHLMEYPDDVKNNDYMYLIKVVFSKEKAASTVKVGRKTYFLENPTEKEKLERMTSVTLYNDGTAQLAASLISSYMLPTCSYTFVGNELLIHANFQEEETSEFFGVENKEVIARFEVVDENTLVFKSATVPLFADVGARYVYEANEDANTYINEPWIGANAKILEINLGNKTMMVEGLDINSPLGDKCLVACKDATLMTVINESLVKIDFADFSVGDIITLDFDGVKESYPTQTTAKRIQRLGTNKPDNTADASAFDYSGTTAIVTVQTQTLNPYVITQNDSGQFVRVELAAPFTLNKNDIVIVKAVKETNSEIFIPFGDLPHVIGEIDNNAISYDTQLLAYANQVYLNGVTAYSQIDGTSLGKRSGWEVVNERKNGWLNVVLPGGDLPFWVRPSDLQSDSSSRFDDLDAAVSVAILKNNKGLFAARDFAAEAHTILTTEVVGPASSNEIETVTVYAMAMYFEFAYNGVILSEVSGGDIPVAVTFEKDGQGLYKEVDYWVPRDRAYNSQAIKERFPEPVVKDILTHKYMKTHTIACYEQAVKYFKVDTDADVAKLIQEICSSPAASSNPMDYIEVNQKEYDALIYYGDYTLRYCFDLFEKGGQTGLDGYIMAAACREILGSKGINTLPVWPPVEFNSGQGWYDVSKEMAQLPKV